MTHTIEHRPQEQIIFASLSGTIKLHDLDIFLEDLIQVIKRENCYTIITDIRQAHFDLSFMQFHDLPKHVERVTASFQFNIRLVKRAFIVNQQLEDFRFYENVSVNRGLATKLCKNMDEAKKAVGCYEMLAV